MILDPVENGNLLGERVNDYLGDRHENYYENGVDSVDLFGYYKNRTHATVQLPHQVDPCRALQTDFYFRKNYFINKFIATHCFLEGTSNYVNLKVSKLSNLGGLNVVTMIYPEMHENFIYFSTLLLSSIKTKNM